MAEEKKGVWRTVRGRRIFIPEGQDLYTAMKNSGKFKELNRGEYQKAKAEVDFKTKRDKYEQGTGSQYGHTAKEAQQLEQKWLKDANEATNKIDRNFALSQMRAWKQRFEETKAYNKQQMKDADFKNQLYGKYYDEPIEADTTGLDGKHMTPKERAKAIDNVNDWREQIKKNNEETQKVTLELEKQRQNDYYRFRQDEWADKYYGAFRDNERRNAKIKKEIPEEKYEYVDSYATYKDKFANYKDGETWTGKAYTNDEFMEHLTDANWHSERRMLEDANLTNAQLTYIKDRVKLGKWSADLDKEKTERLIKEAKASNNKFVSSLTPKQKAKAIDNANKKNEYTSQELKDKYGTDNVDLINAGKAKEDRVSLKKNEARINKINEFAEKDRFGEETQKEIIKQLSEMPIGTELGQVYKEDVSYYTSHGGHTDEYTEALKYTKVGPNQWKNEKFERTETDEDMYLSVAYNSSKMYDYETAKKIAKGEAVNDKSHFKGYGITGENKVTSRTPKQKAAEIDKTNKKDLTYEEFLKKHFGHEIDRMDLSEEDDDALYQEWLKSKKKK